MSSLPDSEIIIIGGGAVGLGCAYALAKAGKADILLLERAEEVGRVTTSQGAGLCGQVRDSPDRVRLAMHSVSVFRELQGSECKPDWNEVGSVRLALSERRVEEFKRLHQASKEAGLETELLDSATAKKHWPLMDLSEVKSVLWCRSDGYMTPTSVAASYRANSAKLGVKFATDTALEGIEIDSGSGRVSGIRTNRGKAKCRWLINSAGASAYHVAKLAGIELPIIPVRHEYFVSVPMAGLSPDLPCFRVPELTLYGRVRDGGLLLGGWEPKALRVDPRDYGIGYQPPPVVTDWSVLDSFGQSFRRLFPGADTAERAWVGKGWPTFTPDGRFIIGESSRAPGFAMASGCNAHGISGSGGIGKLLVEALLDPKPSDYVRSLSPDRFTETTWTWESACRDAAYVYETYYGV